MFPFNLQLTLPISSEVIGVDDAVPVDGVERAGARTVGNLCDTDGSNIGHWSSS